MNRVRVALALLLASAISTPALSQNARQTVTITTSAPIFSTPDEAQSPLRVAKEGSVLLLISTTADWSHVEFQDPEHGRRAGYVERRFVRISAVPGSTGLASPGGAAQQVVRPPTTTNQPLAPIGRPQTREGFWFNGGLGYGSAGCQGCLGREGGLSGGLSAGGAVSPRVLLGVGTSGLVQVLRRRLVEWRDLRRPCSLLSRSQVRFLSDGRPRPGSHQRECQWLLQRHCVRRRGTIRRGWDLRVGRNVSLTPFYNGFAVQTENADGNVGQIGVGITIH